MDRRLFLGGTAALLAVPAVAATSASREFRIIRDGDDIGYHRLEAVRGAGGFELDITIRIAVKVLGITAYRYEMDNREVWQGGRLISLDSTVNDDGTKDFAKARQDGDTLTVAGSRHSGAVTGKVATTSYFVTDFLQRNPWLSTQTGTPLDVKVAPEGRAGWWSVTGKLDTTLGYDGRGEWTGCEFDAGGELATYTVASQSGAFGEIWRAS